MCTVYSFIQHFIFFTSFQDNDAIVKYVTRRIIERVLLGLYKKDKYIVVLHLLRQVYEEVIPENLWKIFVGDTDYVEDQKSITEIKNGYSWMSDGTVKKVAVLQVNYLLCEQLKNLLYILHGDPKGPLHHYLFRPKCCPLFVQSNCKYQC